jgi:hypothetical protein
LKARHARLAKWCELARGAGIPPFPITVHSAEVLVGALREAGYRTAMSYAIRAKQEHIARGHAWTDALALSFKNLEVGCKRGLGPRRQAAELWPNWRAASTG